LADWILFMPLFVAGIIGVLLGQVWGYVLFAVAGAIQLYIVTAQASRSKVAGMKGLPDKAS
jgi:hypothetical protein